LCHSLLRDASFQLHLLELDRAFAAETRQKGCPVCPGRLHVSDYPRKPRGGLERAGADMERRLSFCCAREGCRSRATPPSVRFLGRRVYLAVVVTLASARTQGLSGRRLSRLCGELGLCRRTLERWLSWWRETVPATGWWRELRGRLASPVETLGLPATLLERLGGGEREALEKLLVALAPLSVTARMAARFAMAR
jgi:hypothetical protein